MGNPWCRDTECRDPATGKWYPCTVLPYNGDGTWDIEWIGNGTEDRPNKMYKGDERYNVPNDDIRHIEKKVNCNFLADDGDDYAKHKKYQDGKKPENAMKLQREFLNFVSNGNIGNGHDCLDENQMDANQMDAAAATERHERPEYFDF